MTEVHSLFDPITNTMSYVVWDRASRDAVVIDALMDFDPVTRRTLPWSCQAIIHFARAKRLNVHWLLETHAHADHLTAAREVRAAFPGSRWGMSQRIDEVFETFHDEYEWPDTLTLDHLGVDAFFRDGETFRAGALAVGVIATPGHTPACVTYRIGSKLFTGDALMTPDAGVGRCDFPGGSATDLYDSIQKLFALPDDFETFAGHDYLPGGRPPRARWFLGQQKRENVHLPFSITRDEFAQFRRRRDAGLKTPQLMAPSLDWNLGAHQMFARGEGWVPLRPSPVQAD